MKRYFVILILLFAWITFDVPLVHACSGYGGWLKTLENISQNDVFIRGIIVENSGGNSIIRVERYHKGGGDEYILLYQQSPSLYINKRVRGYGYGCNYAQSPVADVGTRAYFSFNQAPNGTYITSAYYARSNMLSIISSETEQYVTYQEYHGVLSETESFNINLLEEIQVSEPEFETIVADYLGQDSTHPRFASEFENPYPRFRELIVTSESGQQYMMAIDNYELIPLENEPISCQENCPLVSPDGGHFAHPFPDQENRYLIWYSSPANDYLFLPDGWTIGDRHYIPPHIDAQELLFSPDGNFLLAWYENTLSLYSISALPNSGYYGLSPTSRLIWQSPLGTISTLTSETISGQGVWSTNSNAFAYWDVDGLKWLDLTTMSEPRLIVESVVALQRTSTVSNNTNTETHSLLPPILELSTTGRFIRYGDLENWILYDLLTQQSFENALISPDETSMILILSTTPMDEVLANEDGCIVLSANCDLSLALALEHELIEFHWKSNDSFTFLSCHREDVRHCNVILGSLEGRFWNYTTYVSEDDDIPLTIDFVYDSLYREFAWALDDYKLYGNFSPFHSPFDFTDVLDSPIASIEWGEPLWYLGE